MLGTRRLYRCEEPETTESASGDGSALQPAAPTRARLLRRLPYGEIAV